VSAAAEERTVLAGPATLAPDGRLRRTLRLEHELDEARLVGSQCLVTGAGVNDILVDPQGMALVLEHELRSYCTRRELGLVIYRMATGAISLPTLPGEGRAAISAGVRDEHPAQAITRILDEVRTADRPALVVLDHFDEVLPPEAAHDLGLGVLAETVKALTADLAGWQRRGLQLVLVDRGGGIHPRLVDMPGITTLTVGPPDATEATIFAGLKEGPGATTRLHLADGVGADTLGGLSGGLLLRNVAELAALSSPERPIGLNEISEHKGVAIRIASGNTLEHMGDPLAFGTDVAGMHAVQLLISRVLRQNRRTVQVVLCGPPGTGKTYSARAIAALLGVPLVSLGSILGSLLGQSENNMRRALATLRSMAPVALFIDEADQRELGSRTSGGATANEAYDALRAQLFEFTGDTGEDSGVSIIATTNVPTRLDARSKDRFEFVPVLYASGTELAQMMTIQARRGRVPLAEEDLSDLMTGYVETGQVLSGRSSGIVLRTAWNVALDRGADAVTAADVEVALRSRLSVDWTPEAQFSTFTSLLMPETVDGLPWQAARILGQDYPLPAYLQPYVAADGTLRTDILRQRIADLEASGVYR
jgi:hypothetical protein